MKRRLINRMLLVAAAVLAITGCSTFGKRATDPGTAHVAKRSAVAGSEKKAASKHHMSGLFAKGQAGKKSKADEDRIRNLTSLGRLAERRDETAAAEEAYQKIMAEAPDNVLPYHRLAVMRARESRFDEAEILFSKAYERDPKNATLLSDIGYFYYLTSNQKKAENYLRSALKSDPANSVCCNNLALLLGEQGRYAEARKFFQRSCDDAAKVEANMAFVYSQRGELAQAIECYDRSLSLDNTLKPAAHGLLNLTQVEQKIAAATQRARRYPEPTQGRRLGAVATSPAHVNQPQQPIENQHVSPKVQAAAPQWPAPTAATPNPQTHDVSVARPAVEAAAIENPTPTTRPQAELTETVVTAAPLQTETKSMFGSNPQIPEEMGNLAVAALEPTSGSQSQEPLSNQAARNNSLATASSDEFRELYHAVFSGDSLEDSSNPGETTTSPRNVCGIDGGRDAGSETTAITSNPVPELFFDRLLTKQDGTLRTASSQSRNDNLVEATQSEEVEISDISTTEPNRLQETTASIAAPSGKQAKVGQDVMSIPNRQVETAVFAVATQDETTGHQTHELFASLAAQEGAAVAANQDTVCELNPQLSSESSAVNATSFTNPSTIAADAAPEEESKVIADPDPENTGNACPVPGFSLD